MVQARQAVSAYGGHITVSGNSPPTGAKELKSGGEKSWTREQRRRGSCSVEGRAEGRNALSGRSEALRCVRRASIDEAPRTCEEVGDLSWRPRSRYLPVRVSEALRTATTASMMLSVSPSPAQTFSISSPALPSRSLHCASVRSIPAASVIMLKSECGGNSPPPWSGTTSSLMSSFEASGAMAARICWRMRRARGSGQSWRTLRR